MSELDTDAQWLADTNRILKLGFMEHDPEVVALGMQRLTERMGSEFAEKTTLHFITHLMETEGFSFFNEETGKPSPLLGNIYESV